MVRIIIQQKSKNGNNLNKCDNCPAVLQCQYKSNRYFDPILFQPDIIFQFAAAKCRRCEVHHNDAQQAGAYISVLAGGVVSELDTLTDQSVMH